MTVRPPSIRSVLFASPFRATPGDESHVPSLDQARESAAAAILFDLEDTVTERERPRVRDVLSGMAGPDSRVWVRINGTDHPQWREDLEAAVAVASTIVVSKVASSAHLNEVSSALNALGSDAALVALVETAQGLLQLPSICESQPGRLRAICLGIGDLTSDLNATYTGLGEMENYARCRVVEASAAFGLAPPIDTAALFVGDEDFIRQECRLAKRMGFGGKLCLTLPDVAIVTEEFAPSAKEIAWARKIVHAFAEAVSSGMGQVIIDGAIIDLPVVNRARDVLKQADER